MLATAHNSHAFIIHEGFCATPVWKTEAEKSHPGLEQTHRRQIKTYMRTGSGHSALGSTFTAAAAPTLDPGSASSVTTGFCSSSSTSIGSSKSTPSNARESFTKRQVAIKDKSELFFYEETNGVKVCTFAQLSSSPSSSSSSFTFTRCFSEGRAGLEGGGTADVLELGWERGGGRITLDFSPVAEGDSWWQNIIRLKSFQLL